MIYRPRIKERPATAARAVLDDYRRGLPADLEPLARRKPSFEIPAAWKLGTFRDRGFLYLWNVSHTSAIDTWLGDKPDRVRFPYNVADAPVRQEFEKKYGGRDDVPIFSDPRIVPTFHGVGAGVFATDAKTGELSPLGQRFAKWLDANPDRAWAMMMNYHGGAADRPGRRRARSRNIASDTSARFQARAWAIFILRLMKCSRATAASTTRRQLVEAFSPVTLAANAAKYRAVYGRDLDKHPYRDVIACLSIGNITFVPLCFDWGARIAGYESAAATSSLLPMRWAFMRGTRGSTGPDLHLSKL